MYHKRDNGDGHTLLSKHAYATPRPITMWCVAPVATVETVLGTRGEYTLCSKQTHMTQRPQNSIDVCGADSYKFSVRYDGVKRKTRQPRNGYALFPEYAYTTSRPQNTINMVCSGSTVDMKFSMA